jgi:hypothetical protein
VSEANGVVVLQQLFFRFSDLIEQPPRGLAASPLLVQGGELLWASRFEFDSTSVPKCSRIH